MTNPFFAQGPDWRLNACLNYGLDEWRLYASGYRRAAEVILRYVKERHTDQDVLIFPFFFNWQHHIELQLKGIAREASALMDEDYSPPITHDLHQLLAQARGLVIRAYAMFDEKRPTAELEAVREILKRLRQIDGTLMAFRYPEDPSGAKHLEGLAHVNFEVVATQMRQLSDTLEEVSGALAVFADWQNDARSAY